MVRSGVLVFLAVPCAAAASWALACSGNWCTTWGSKLLCDDFDDSTSVTQEGLSHRAASGEAGGALALSSETAYTPPNSVLGSSSAFDAGQGAGMQVAGSLWAGTRPAPAVLTCELQLAPVQLSSAMGDSAMLVTLSIGDPSGALQNQVSLAVDTAGNLSFVESYPMQAPEAGPGDPPDACITDAGSDSPADGGLAEADSAPPEASVDDSMVLDAPGPEAAGSTSMVAHSVAARVTPGNWTQVQMQFTTGPTSTQFSISAGGGNITGSLQQAFPPTMSANLSVGLADVSSVSSGWSFLFDDVVCH